MSSYQVGPPVVEATVVSTKGHYGFAEIEAAGAAKLGLGEHTRMFFHTSQVQHIYSSIERMQLQLSVLVRSPLCRASKLGSGEHTCACSSTCPR